jgi:hypothetical protein
VRMKVNCGGSAGGCRGGGGGGACSVAVAAGSSRRFSRLRSGIFFFGTGERCVDFSLYFCARCDGARSEMKN